MKRILVVFIVALTCVGAMWLVSGAQVQAEQTAAVEVAEADVTAPKYVFLFIGDGMGFPQKTAAEMVAGERLVIDQFPAQGVTTTYAADRFITGSAASATAMASGQKTNIGMLDQTPDGQHVVSIAEMARDMGMKVGIISSVSIDHATPAAFYAHVPKRGQYYDIDVALAQSNFDFFGGGGIKDPTNKRENATEFVGDVNDLLAENGYSVIDNRDDFMALTPESGKVVCWNNWLQDSGAMPYHMDVREGEDITIAEFTAKAIEMLDNENGFFIMVEGGKIDWACHANDGTAAIEDTLAFDAAVQHAVDFYNAHPDETLIVVSGDHECGGLTLGFAGTKYASNFELLGAQTVSFQYFTAEILADFKEQHADGATFEDIKPLITEYFGLKFEGAEDDLLVLRDSEIAQLEEAFELSMSGETIDTQDYQTYVVYSDSYDPLALTLTHVLNQKAGLGWTSYKHTGVPVGTSAIGIGHELFNGYYDNTDVALKIMDIMGIDPQVHMADTTVGEEVAAQ